MTFISRRDLLKRAAAVGASPLATKSYLGPAFQGGHDVRPERADLHDGMGGREPLENLTASEADLLDAVVARLIPTDAAGPGATEARAVRYIDRALGGPLASSRPAYTSGLAALDRFARSLHGKSFTDLAPAAQDAVLTAVESGAATGFTGSAAFFALLLSHTHQGTFGDPYYGGNANFVGWDLIGYPGVRTMVTVVDQERLEKGELKTNHKSAYDYDTFTKASGKTGGR